MSLLPSVISRGGQYLGRGQVVEISAAGLTLSVRGPRGQEARLLLRLVSPELDDHEVGGRGEALAPELLGHGARQGGDGGGSLLSAASAQDLDSVKHLLCLETGKLKTKIMIVGYRSD